MVLGVASGQRILDWVDSRPTLDSLEKIDVKADGTQSSASLSLARVTYVLAYTYKVGQK